MTTATGGVAMGEREAGRASRVSPFWRVLVLLIGVLVLAHDADHAWGHLTGHPGYGDFGYDSGACRFDGFCSIDAVKPGGPMAAQGVRKGDALRFDRALDASRKFRIGERLGFTLRRDGGLSHHTATARPSPAESRIDAVVGAVSAGAWALTGLIGLFVTLRSRGRASTVLLGAALCCLGSMGDIADLAESHRLIIPAFVLLATSVVYAPPVLFLAFARQARRETSGKAARAWTVILFAYAAALTVLCADTLWERFTLRPLVDDHVSLVAQVLASDLGYLLAIVALGAAWRESRGQDRTRYAFMLVAIGLLTLSLDVTGTLINLTGDDWSLNNPLVTFLIVGSITGAGVFAYAVLRHRVLDLGFAVSRTLVYGVLSTLLLVAFGLIEWAVDHLMPRDSHETSAVIDAGVALAVFLTFHRVRDFVEHLVEGIFFRPWQQAEAGLRRFVREAAFATRAETLTGAFATALTRYAEGAQAAVYLQGDDGGYRLADGAVAGLGQTLDADDAALMAIRAEPKALVPDPDASSLNAALIAPMVNRNEVVGVAVLGAKPSGNGYRPDEIELVGWATRQVGLDLHALKMEQLEAARARQDERIAVLSAKVEGLMAGRQPA